MELRRRQESLESVLLKIPQARTNVPIAIQRIPMYEVNLAQRRVNRFTIVTNACNHLKC